MLSLLFTSLLLSTNVHGFAPIAVSVRQIVQQSSHMIISPAARTIQTRTALRSSIPVYDADAAAALLNQAVDCSLSDTCSVDEAEWYLKEIVTIQSRCVTGVLIEDDVCDNQQVTAEIVAQLRHKISTSNNKGGVVAAAATGISPMNAVAALTIATALMARLLTTNFGGADGDTVVAFTMEEWWWSLRDGYLPLQIIHFIKNGGLIQ